MKFSTFSRHKYFVPVLLGIFALISILLHVYKIELPCLNSDEAAFGYNAYSIAKTGKDEYGYTMPVRFKSFGENKLPVIEYLSVPFMWMMGLNEISTRMIIYIFSVIAPFVFYYFVKAVTKNRTVALIAAFLSSVSPWIQITGRSAHEVLIAYSLVTAALVLMWQFQQTHKLRYLIYASILNGVALFTYHLSKIYAVFFLGWLLVYIWQQKRKHLPQIGKLLLIFAVPVVLFLFTELMYPTTRISNLLFYKTSGFTSAIEELRKENNIQLIHNKATRAVIQLSNNYISYFSPEFLILKGDANQRYGYPGISPISFVEYLFLFVGLYYLFKNKESSRYLLVALLLFAPLSASISYLEHSLTRSFFMIVPILTIASYGFYYFIKELPQFRVAAAVGISLIYFFFLFFTWEFYFYHYFQKPQVMEAWQCGYKEVGQYIKQNYYQHDLFYVSKKAGQPYIFTLFYTQYPPEKYQGEASLSPLGEYGFGEVEHYNKFVFNFEYPGLPHSVLIGKPDEFNGTGVDKSKIKKIQMNGYDLFYIYAHEGDKFYSSAN